MKINLWTLNESYRSLERLAQKELSKEHFKITFKLGRIFKSAKSHMDQWTQEDLGIQMARFGIKQLPNGEVRSLNDRDEKGDLKPATAEQVEPFNRAAKEIMQNEICDLVGDHYTPFDAAELLKAITLNSVDFGLLYGWLIDGELPESLPEEKPRAQSAGAD